MAGAPAAADPSDGPSAEVVEKWELKIESAARIGVALTIVGVLPLMILHYALSFGAIFAPPMLDWPLLVIDALAVGFLALTMSGASTVAALHAARRRKVELTGDPKPSGNPAISIA